jgi:hypothetical protein
MTKAWEDYRDAIIGEYKNHNKPLHEVQRIMEEKYRFKASYVSSSLFSPSSSSSSCSSYLFITLPRFKLPTNHTPSVLASL